MYQQEIGEHRPGVPDPTRTALTSSGLLPDATKSQTLLAFLVPLPALEAGGLWKAVTCSAGEPRS